MKLRSILSTLIITSLCAFLIITAQQHRQSLNPSKNSKISPGVISVDEFNFSEYKDNGLNKKFTVRGKTLRPGSKKISIFNIGPAKTVEVRDVEVTFYANNIPVASIRSKKAVFDMPFEAGRKDKDKAAKVLTSRIDFFGDITILTKDRRTLTCRNLTLDSRRDRLFARGDCVLGYEGKTVRADTVDSDVYLKDFSCKNDKMKRLKAIGKILS